MKRGGVANLSATWWLGNSNPRLPRMYFGGVGRFLGGWGMGLDWGGFCVVYEGVVMIL